MDTPAQTDRLTQADLQLLDEYLREHGFSPGLAGADGIFAAVATLPRLIPPAEWMGLIVDHLEPPETEEAAQALIGKLMLRYTAVSDALLDAAPDAVLPEPNNSEQIADFCEGYLAASHLDQEFGKDEFGVMMLLPMAVLSGAFPVSELKEANGMPLADPEAWCSERRQTLRDDVMRLYDYCNDLRQRQSAAGSRRSSQNERCPCGSGKSYRQCCGSN